MSWSCHLLLSFVVTLKIYITRRRLNRLMGFVKQQNDKKWNGNLWSWSAQAFYSTSSLSSTHFSLDSIHLPSRSIGSIMYSYISSFISTSNCMTLSPGGNCGCYTFSALNVSLMSQPGAGCTRSYLRRISVVSRILPPVNAAVCAFIHHAACVQLSQRYLSGCVFIFALLITHVLLYCPEPQSAQFLLILVLMCRHPLWHHYFMKGLLLAFISKMSDFKSAFLFALATLIWKLCYFFVIIEPL